MESFNYANRFSWRLEENVHRTNVNVSTKDMYLSQLISYLV